MKIIEKWQNIPVLFKRLSPLITHEIGKQNSRVINSILDIPTVESIEQFQPLLTAIAQVIPSITNDFYDPTLTRKEQ